jgi:hypothetical protein
MVMASDLRSLCATLRSRFVDPLTIAVVDAHSRTSRQLLDDLIEAGGVLPGDAVVVVALGPEADAKFEFGELLDPSRSFEVSVVPGTTKGGRQILDAHLFDILILPAERPEEVKIAGDLLGAASFVLVGMRAGSSQTQTLRDVLKRLAPRDWRPAFAKVPNFPDVRPEGDRRHCIPLATLGTNKSVDAFLERAPECGAHRDEPCGAAACPASYVREILLPLDSEETVAPVGRTRR